MRIKFISSLLTIAALAALAFSAPSAKAEKATIQLPFKFMVGKQVCPAGAYTITRDAKENQIALVNKSIKLSFKWAAQQTSNPTKKGQGHLFFSVSKDEHTLRSVQIGDQSTAQLNVSALPGDHVAEITTE